MYPCDTISFLVTLVPVLCLITSFYLHVSQLLASLSCSIIIFPTSVHYSLPPHSDFIYLTFCPLWLCESFSTFSRLPRSLSYSEPCSLSLACNCHPLLPTQSPPSLPQSPINLSPDNTIPLCLPCLSPLKLRTPLFLGEGATHKLKPSLVSTPLESNL